MTNADAIKRQHAEKIQRQREHAQRLMDAGRARVYSGENSYLMDVIAYDEVEDRVQVRFDSTGRVDWYPRPWLYVVAA